MTALSGKPAYQQVADDLRAKITKKRLAVGSQLPSASELMRTYDVSSTVIKAAINQLRIEGLVIGQQGKGVFVRERTEADEQASEEFTALTTQISELRDALGALNDRVAAVEERLPPQKRR